MSYKLHATTSHKVGSPSHCIQRIHARSAHMNVIYERSVLKKTPAAHAHRTHSENSARKGKRIYAGPHCAAQGLIAGPHCRQFRAQK